MSVYREQSKKDLQYIKKLESPEDWPSWHKQIKNCLIMTGFTAILERQTEMPKQHEAGGENNENEANGAYQARLEAWMDKQSQAFATVDETCGYRASKLLMAEKEKKTPIKQALEVLDKEFEESGSGRYEDLCATFNDLSLSNCKNVSDYGAQIQKVTDDMQTLHSTVALPESFVVQKFLHGLTDSFKEFKTSFNLRYAIVASDKGEDKDQDKAVSIKRTIKLAEEYEGRNLKDATKAYFSGNRQQNLQQRKACLTCNKQYPHPAGQPCWEADDSAAPEWWKLLKAARLARKQTQQKRPYNNKDTGISIMGAATKKVNFGDHYQGKFGITLCTESAQPTDNTALFTDSSTSGEYMAIHRGMNLWDAWILDSGASGHLIGRKDAFVEGSLEAIEGHKANGIGGATVTPVAKGTLRVQCKTAAGTRWLEIPEVRYSPKAGVNLLSLSELWPYIDNIHKTGNGLTFTQGIHRFGATIKAGLLMLDTTA